jgi:hypothetical protein
VEEDDGSKYGAVIRARDPNDSHSAHATEEELDMLRLMLQDWGLAKTAIANRYINDHRNRPAFLYDTFALVRYLNRLSRASDVLAKINDDTTLMHNRIIAQVMYEYEQLGYVVDSKPQNFLIPRKHDFNVGNFRCEVKTILTLGKLERSPLGLWRFTDSCAKSLLSALYDDIAKAKEQAGKDGVIILAPWSYKINSVFLTHFENRLSKFPPALAPGMTILILSSDLAFEDYYIALPSARIESILTDALTNIQTYGMKGYMYTLFRGGFAISIMNTGSNFRGLTYDIEEE